MERRTKMVMSTNISSREYPKIDTLFDRDDSFRVIATRERIKHKEYLLVNKWIVTEKIHGTNIRATWVPGEDPVFEGRSDEAQMPPFVRSKLKEIFPRSLFESVYPDPKFQKIVLYGEAYGARIQRGGGNYRSDVGFRLFD